MSKNNKQMNTTQAEITLKVISTAFFNGRNYNDTHRYDNLSKTPEGGLTGIVSEIVRRGEIKVLGNFVIDVDGKIKDFPGLPQDIIEGINMKLRIARLWQILRS